MLKIKDDIDLKELEKYGFKKEEYKTYYGATEYDMRYYSDCHQGGDTFICANSLSRHLNIWLDMNKELIITELDIIYDLIKDGLVEKV